LSSNSEPPSKSRRQFIKYGVAGAVGFGVASAIEIPILNNALQNDNSEITKKDSQISSLTTQNNDLKSQLSSSQQMQAFLTLNPITERPVVEALAEAIIPGDSSDPGAKEAGVIYFIDRMLAGNYGKAGNMFMQGPFIHPQKGSLTVQGITYSGGTITPRLQAGTAYQYAFSPREFWRRGLISLQSYCNSAYGGDFEKLASAQQIQVLQDLFDNKSDNSKLQDAFQAPNAAEFFNEVHDLVTAGFWSDPVYGGNQGMVGWKHIAFNANYWGDDKGLGAPKLMLQSTPTRLPPMSLSDLQKAGGGM
jgi:gluconate 2-dehydrogenase gamma chain